MACLRYLCINFPLVSLGTFSSTEELYRSHFSSCAVSQRRQTCLLCNALFSCRRGSVSPAALLWRRAGAGVGGSTSWPAPGSWDRSSLSLPSCYSASGQDHTGERGTGQRRKGEGRGYLHLPAKWLVGRKLLWWGEGPKGVVAGCVAPVRTRYIFSWVASDCLYTQRSWPSHLRTRCEGTGQI